MVVTPRRLPYVLSSPAFLLLVALCCHVAGRVAAISCPFKVDSVTYSVSAFDLYDANITIDDLVPDKPPGQALLTGWVYRLLPGPPTRLTLMPVESAFMFAGYLVFWWLAVRLWGSRLSAALTLFLVVAFNTWNALDTTTDGFNLAENYLLLPMAAAVCFHCLASSGARGLGRGIAVGLALSIKQTAASLLLAFLLHDLWIAVVKRRPGESARLAGWTVVGVILGTAPVVAFLLWRGWLGTHLHQLLTCSGGHLAWMPIAAPPWFKIQPLLPVAWWIALGLAACWAGAGRRPPDADPDRRQPAACFLGCWLTIEIVLLWSMRKPCMHYYQQLILPAALAAGLGVHRLRLALASSPARGIRIWRCVAAASAVLVIWACMPLFAELPRRCRCFDARAEVTDFADWLRTRSPADTAIYAPKRPPR